MIWRPPTIRTPHTTPGSAVSWTELFYDLMFVVAIWNLGERFVKAQTLTGALEFVGLFGMLWWAWASLTFLIDRYESNDIIDRMLAVIQMVGVAGFAAAAARPGRFDAVAVPIAASYLLTRLGLIGMYARVWWYIPDSRPLVGGYLRGFGLDALVWLISMALPSPTRYVLWAVAMLVSLATPWLMRREQVHSPLNTSHLPERLGVFTILVLGGPITAVVTAMRAEQAHTAALLAAGAGFAITVGLWWIYFDNHEGSVVRRDPNRRRDWRPTAWIYAHYPLTLCVAAFGASMAHIVSAGGHTAQRGLALTCALSLAGALAALAVILVSTANVSASSRRRRALTRFGGAALAAAIAIGAARLSPPAFLGALAFVLVLQVLGDLVPTPAEPARAYEPDPAS